AFEFADAYQLFPRLGLDARRWNRGLWRRGRFGSAGPGLSEIFSSRVVRQVRPVPHRRDEASGDWRRPRGQPTQYDRRGRFAERSWACRRFDFHDGQHGHLWPGNGGAESADDNAKAFSARSSAIYTNVGWAVPTTNRWWAQ